MSLHPQIIEKDGRKESVVLPDEEFAASSPRITRSSFQRSRPPVALAQAFQRFSVSAFQHFSISAFQHFSFQRFSIYPRVLPHRHQPQRKLGTCLRNLFR